MSQHIIKPHTYCIVRKKTPLLLFNVKSKAWKKYNFPLFTLSWSISVSPVMTILFSMRVSEIPPFTVYNRDTAQAKTPARKQQEKAKSIFIIPQRILDENRIL